MINEAVIRIPSNPSTEENKLNTSFVCVKSPHPTVVNDVIEKYRELLNRGNQLIPSSIALESNE